jgi:hypothetical protein
MAVVEHVIIAPGDWAQVMANLHDRGYTFTESALKYVVNFCFAGGHQIFQSFTRRSVFPIIGRRFSQLPCVCNFTFSTTFCRLSLTCATTCLDILDPTHSLAVKSKAMAATVWDDQAHLCLLQGIFQHVTFTSDEWAKILAYTQERGYNYSSSAAM